MTKEEAIKMLKGKMDGHTDTSYEWAETVRMAIKALEQEPCGDAISRQELLKAISTWDKFGCDADTKLVPYKDHYVPYIHYDDVINCINGMPSVTPQPKMGHWIREANIKDVYDTAGVKTWGVRHRCDRCNFSTIIIEDFGYYKYCPNCGAKMQEE